MHSGRTSNAIRPHKASLLSSSEGAVDGEGEAPTRCAEATEVCGRTTTKSLPLRVTLPPSVVMSVPVVELLLYVYTVIVVAPSLGMVSVTWELLMLFPLLSSRMTCKSPTGTWHYTLTGSRCPRCSCAQPCPGSSKWVSGGGGGGVIVCAVHKAFVEGCVDSITSSGRGGWCSPRGTVCHRCGALLPSFLRATRCTQQLHWRCLLASDGAP